MSKQNLDELIDESEDAIEKGEDLSEIEAEHHHKDKEKPKSQKSKIEDQIKEKKFDKSEQAENEADTIEENDTDEAQKADKKAKKNKKAKVRSKKYSDAKSKIDVKKIYDLEDALELVKQTSFTKFKGNIELNIRILNKSGKPEQVRGMINYPYSTGKKVNVVILDEKLIEEISTSKKITADIYLATPELMPKVGKLAKILGHKGKMPNPKAGTVTAKPEETKKNMEAGQSEYKTDSYGIVHQVIGKTDAKTQELVANYKELISALPKDKIASIYLYATMGPSVKVQK